MSKQSSATEQKNIASLDAIQSYNILIGPEKGIVDYVLFLYVHNWLFKVRLLGARSSSVRQQRHLHVCSYETQWIHGWSCRH